MIQALGDFLRKWGNVLGISIGVIFILITILMDLRGISQYEYFDFKRNSKVEMPLVVNYFTGSFIILMGIKKQWISDLAGKIRSRRRKRN
ncbi:hypothetical protein [Chitinophaga silvisoli]|uniref:Uncharacterized protein n=1 Tax=Chitinophaga silvisoli TaxID=2291814 RepID=A0A3E1NUB6_9BACT|nr:hypothetical protein [Chitinophaga silvisoli]RFM31532.1 hypothetical protein DXN04_27845 [Chitinophaga silvisoli]